MELVYIKGVKTDRKTEPLVSVLITCYNEEKYIGEAIQSIIDQTYKNIEILIQDDHSEDNSWKIVADYQKKDKRIKAFRNDENYGRPYVRNKLVEKARGKYIAWQDGDDISFPERIALQVEYLENKPEVVAVGGGLLLFKGSINNITEKRDYSDDQKYLKSKVFRFSPFAQGVSMVRKSVIDRVGKYDEHFLIAQDYDMMFRLGMKGEFGNIQKPLLYYRQHSESATYKKFKTQIINTTYIRLYYHIDSNYYKMSFMDKIANTLTYAIIIISPDRSLQIFRTLRKIITLFKI